MCFEFCELVIFAYQQTSGDFELIDNITSTSIWTNVSVFDHSQTTNYSIKFLIYHKCKKKFHVNANGSCQSTSLPANCQFTFGKQVELQIFNETNNKIGQFNTCLYMNYTKEHETDYYIKYIINSSISQILNVQLDITSCMYTFIYF